MKAATAVYVACVVITILVIGYLIRLFVAASGSG
jgi:hypothetical protein